ncbi:MAG: PDZ domain-containing protein, partial [Planctomycetota bacterium]
PVQPDNGDRGGAAERADAPPPVGGAAEPEPKAPLRYVTLGSIDDQSEYRMLVTLTSQGAAVRRSEMSSPRFLDLHGGGGYLGHLELANDGRTGLLVQTAGAGTPAAAAGVRVGDRILEAGGDELQPVASPNDLHAICRSLKPGQAINLRVERDGDALDLSAALGRHPLDVIRPESENVLLRHDKLPADFWEQPSFLLTLDRVNGRSIDDDSEELPGVDLRTANWEVVEQTASTVTFERRVAQYGLVVSKRYELAKREEDRQDDANSPAYHLFLTLSIRNVSDDPMETAYRLDGPNGLPIEGWWYATKIGRNWGGNGLRDVLGRYLDGEPEQQSPAKIADDDTED